MKIGEIIDVGGGGGHLAETLPPPIRIPHPRECVPRRPPRTPMYEPRRDRRDAGRPAPPSSVLQGWHSPDLVAADDGGQLRINFRYSNVFTTAAGYGEKPRRAVYVEGPHEQALWRLLEMNTEVEDYLFQPLAINWLTTMGAIVTYTTDVIYSTPIGGLHVEEVKATQAYFDDPNTADQLDLFERELAGLGVTFGRRIGRDLADPVFRDTVKEAFDDRRTGLDDGDVERVQAAIVRAGGVAPLGYVLEALPYPGRAPLARLHAMMVRRLASYDLRRPPMPDTPVTIPAPATKPGALGAFLAGVGRGR